MFLVASLTVLACAQSKSASTRNRIRTEIDDETVQTLRGTLHPAALSHLDLGRVASDMPVQRVTMVFKLSAQQQQDLDTLLTQQQDPTSANYHKWLLPQEYQARFGVSDADLAKAKSWLQSQGLNVIEESSDHSAIVFSGRAAFVERAFHTELHNYLSDSGETHFANSSDISIPAALADVVLGVRAVDDFRPRPRVHTQQVQSRFTSSLSGSHFLAPDDFATIYDLKPLYNAGFTGSGQMIAVVGQSDITVSDTTTFRSLSGLPASDPLVVLVPRSGDPGTVAGDVDESNLDIQWAGAVAPGATIVFVNSGNGAFDSLQYAIQQDIAPIISVSYGDCEANFRSSEITTFGAFFQQASSQGQTLVVASGDAGAADCDSSVGSATHGLAVDFPSSSPEFTAVGGSTFNEGSTPAAFWTATNNTNNGSAISYIPEVAWNDTALSSGSSLDASGGGVSKLFLKPSWQSGTGVPADGQRDVPDITFNASNQHDGYLICSQGSCQNGYRRVSTDQTINNTLTVVGGTSAGAPSFAGVVALLNQKIGSAQGNLNPAIYSLAGTTPAAFHDITSGDNKVPCTSGRTDCPAGTTSIGFLAGTGYDLVTGLGSVDAATFVSSMAAVQAASPTPDFQIRAATPRISFSRSASSTDAITVSAVNGFSGAVALTCSVSTSLTNTTCSISPATVSGSGAATLTMSATALASNHAPANMPGSLLWPSGLFGLAAIVVAGRPRGIKRGQILLGLMIVVMIGAAVGCGGGGSSSTSTATTTVPSTPAVVSTPVSGTVTVRGTSGATVHTVQIAVTVN
jgi:subtilase family serine protease